MSLYIPTWKEKQEAKEERMDIIEMLMEVRNPETLSKIKSFVSAYTKDDYKSNPMPLDEFVAYLDLPMVIRMKDLFKDVEEWCSTKKQIDELCTKAIESYEQEEGGAVYDH